MTDPELPESDEEIIDVGVESQEVELAKKEIVARCKVAEITVVEFSGFDDEPLLQLGMKCGRDIRQVFFDPSEIVKLSSVAFEKYVFLPDLDAICSYEDGFIEAAVRPLGPNVALGFVYRRLFKLDRPNDLEAIRFVIEPPQGDLPRFELSPASDVFNILVQFQTRFRLTLKLFGCKVTTNDRALALLTKLANSAFFQIDLLSEVAISLERERRQRTATRRPRKNINLTTDLQYPKREFDEVPISLYWYARSAAGMPLLQFLAFYQVIEFYFPIYSRAEAQRKLKAVLRDPTFRGDRDADIGKLLSAISASRSGSFGDERSQLRATLTECTDPDVLRDFLESVPERREFYLGKGKSQLYHKIPLSNASTDLRNDVADRVYDIRCKIVHSKGDSRDGEVELLLPFSKEAAQLFFDIELVQYLAQLVLIAASTPFSASG
jgi:hypothetical protein